MATKEFKKTSSNKKLIPLKMDVSMEFTNSIRKWISIKLPYEEISSRLIKYGDKVSINADKKQEQLWSYIIADFINAGFKIINGYKNELKLQPPNLSTKSNVATKEIVRQKMLINRNEIILQPSVREFFYKMHKERFFNEKYVSIETLIDNGNSLYKELNKLQNKLTETETIEDQIKLVKTIINPEIEIVTDNTKDQITNLLLSDIWRYFRYTWSHPSKGQVGRGLSFLIRNVAKKNKPIMGIGSLANPVLNLTARDVSIGWKPLSVIVSIINDLSTWKKHKNTFIKVLNDNKNNIKHDDMIPKILINDFENNTIKIEKHLEGIEKKAKDKRIEILKLFEEQKKSAFKFSENPPENPYSKEKFKNMTPLEKSIDPLFVCKRARHLIRIIQTLRELDKISFDANEFIDDLYIIKDVIEKNEYGYCSKEKKYKKLKYGDKKIILSSNNINSTIAKATQYIRTEGLASCILDLNVCGATIPYRNLLLGKLVALAAGSNEISKAYFNKYKNAVSEISSNVAGKNIIRKPIIKAITTTSLYSINPSQYNRLKINIKDKKNYELKWECVGVSRGIGTLQFSNRTTKFLSEYTRELDEYSQVNGIFGEGTSALLRKVRSGFADIIGNDVKSGISEDLLRHDNSRIVYILKMYPEVFEDLCMNKSRKFDVPNFEMIKNAWISRYLINRIQKKEIIDTLQNQNNELVKKELLLNKNDFNTQMNLI